jgi:D-arabinose 1-dehydrogenase-like Zn-dependent alcohol dehydrogenase
MVICVDFVLFLGCQYMSFLVVACGVCHSDLHVIKGEIPFASPCAIGHEITGEVVEHGELTDRKTIERYMD